MIFKRMTRNNVNWKNVATRWIFIHLMDYFGYCHYSLTIFFWFLFYGDSFYPIYEVVTVVA